MELLNEYGTANLAVEGYQIEIMDDFLRGINLNNLVQASAIVLMIGADNIARLEKSDLVFDKVVAFIETVRQKFDSGAKIILLTVLPRDSPGLNRVISTVNTRLFNKYKAYKMVNVVDLTSIFFQANTGKLDPSLYAANLYHINTAGYKMILEKILPLLKDVPKLDQGQLSSCDLSILDTYALILNSPSSSTNSMVAAGAYIKETRAPTPQPSNEPTLQPAVVPTAKPTLPYVTTRDNPGRPDGTTTTPLIHKRHAEFEPEILSELTRFNEKTKLVLFGDSILYKFGTFSPLQELNPLNLASPSFHTENVLYRLKNTDLKAIKNIPIVALMVGGFNVGSRDSPDAVVNGMIAVIKEIKTIFSPSTKVLLFSILPRNSKVLNSDIFEINKAISFYGNLPDLGFTYVDLTNRFWDAPKNSVVDKMFETDKFSPSQEGYKFIKEVLVSITKDNLDASSRPKATPEVTKAVGVENKTVKSDVQGSGVSGASGASAASDPASPPRPPPSQSQTSPPPASLLVETSTTDASTATTTATASSGKVEVDPPVVSQTTDQGGAGGGGVTVELSSSPPPPPPPPPSPSPSPSADTNTDTDTDTEPVKNDMNSTLSSGASEEASDSSDTNSNSNSNDSNTEQSKHPAHQKVLFIYYFISL